MIRWCTSFSSSVPGSLHVSRQATPRITSGPPAYHVRPPPVSRQVPPRIMSVPPAYHVSPPHVSRQAPPRITSGPPAYHVRPPPPPLALARLLLHNFSAPP